jgi:hypothetical protein
MVSATAIAIVDMVNETLLDHDDKVSEMVIDLGYDYVCRLEAGVRDHDHHGSQRDGCVWNAGLHNVVYDTFCHLAFRE